MARNPPSVRVIIPSPSFSTNLDALSAYVGLGKDHQLTRYFVETVPVSNVQAYIVYETFAAEKRGHLGMARSYPVPPWNYVLQFACDKTTPLQLLAQALPFPVDISHDVVSYSKRGLWTYVTSMHRLIEADSDPFAG